MADRIERVTLELVDNFSTRMARVAASTEAASRSLHDLDGSNRDVSRSTTTMQRDVDRTSSSFRRAGADIDSYSGRLSLLGTAALSLGPALVPLGAAVLPAVTGLAAGLGAAGAAAGTAVLAFHGLGDALKAVDAARLAPTKENLQAMRTELDKVGPATAHFATFLDSLAPSLTSLQHTAASGLFPGLEAGIKQLTGGLPAVKGLVHDLAAEMGRLADDAGHALANDDDWQRFFAYVKTDAVPTLDTFAKAAGNVASGLVALLTDFAPLSRSFSSELLTMSKNFRTWADNLGSTDGFHQFIDYIKTSGPQVGAFLEAIGHALVALTQAAAPWGQVVLPALTAAANVFTKVASSPIGPVLFSAAAGALALSKAVGLLKAANPVLLGLTGAATGIALLSRGFDDTDRSAGAMARQLANTAWADKQNAALASVRGSLDQVSGAYTKATRAAVLTELQNNGLVKAGQQLGLSSTTLINATLGEASARKKVADATSQQNVQTLKSTTLTKDNYKSVTGQLHAIDQLRTSLPDVTRQTAAQRKAVQDQSIAVNGLAKTLGVTKHALDAWPKALRTKLSVDGIPQGMKGVASLGSAVKGLTNHQWAVLLKAAGVDPTRANIAKAQDAADRFARTHATATLGVHDGASGTIAHVNSELTYLNGRRATAYITTLHLDKFERTTQKAAGGYITGPGTATSDSIPARLSNGEYVVRAAAVDRYGVSMLDRINSMAYANGGLVQQPSAVQRFASGGVVAGSTGVALRTDLLQTALDDLTKSVDRAKASVTSWRDKQSELVSSLRTSLTVDAFGAGDTSWNATSAAGSLASWRTAERGQRTTANQLARDIATLRREGASDAFISYILSQSDPATVAHQFATESRKSFRADQALYTSSATAVNRTATAGGAIYNNEIKASNAKLDALRAEVKATNAELKALRAQSKAQHADNKKDRANNTAAASQGTAKAINGAARQGHRDRKR